MADHPRIVVVGAGIVGASIGWHLASAGARVTILDAGEPGGIATRGSWAWINASWHNPLPYFRLRTRSMEEWKRIARDVPGVEVAWSGGLVWDMPREDLETFVSEHAGWGYRISLVERDEIMAREPALADPPALAAYAPDEGAVEPLATALAFLAAAQVHGAEILPGRAATGLSTDDGRVTGVATDAGVIEADEVVVAAGVATPDLVASAGVPVPLRDAPGIVVATAPMPPLLNHLLVPPEMELRQTADGRLLAAAHIEAAGMADGGATRAEEIFADMKRLVKGGEALVAAYHRTANRPMPRDGFPLVGRAPGVAGLYTAVTHSGITLAPAIGLFVSEEILAGKRDALLAPYELARDSG